MTQVTASYNIDPRECRVDSGNPCVMPMPDQQPYQRRDAGCLQCRSPSGGPEVSGARNLDKSQQCSKGGREAALGGSTGPGVTRGGGGTFAQWHKRLLWSFIGLHTW